MKIMVRTVDHFCPKGFWPSFVPEFYTATLGRRSTAGLRTPLHQVHIPVQGLGAQKLSGSVGRFSRPAPRVEEPRLATRPSSIASPNWLPKWRKGLRDQRVYGTTRIGVALQSPVPQLIGRSRSSCR